MNNFTKSDLKVGMIVETRDGRSYITHEFEDELILANKNGCLRLINYKENLLFYNMKSEVAELDIMNVRKPNKPYQFINNCWCDAPVIWERKELPKLTEVEKIILKNAIVYDNKPEWISRDKDGMIYLYINRPEKDEEESVWMSDTYLPLKAYNHLFQFIKWDDSDPYSVSDLLSTPSQRR